jgi:putative DNA primase/helicase
MSSPVENLVQRLNAKRSGQGWKAKCPVHDDHTPSLSISEGADGRALIHCFAGCQTEDVLSALGMSKRDLFTDDITALAALHPLEYERERKKEAKRLGCREAVLDKLVEAKRTKGNDTLQGSDVMFPDVEPWLDPVDGADVLAQTSVFFRRHIALPDGAADVLALWCAHAHIFQAFTCSPRLNITSPDKGCGKTTLRDVVALFVPRPLPAENLSSAVLFRVTEKYQPTLLGDEYDGWLRDNDELRSLLNAGHRSGGKALRCEGESNEVRAFNVFAPAVLCGIGPLPGTLHDRAIVIRLVRAKPGEVAARFDSRRTGHAIDLFRKLARWCSDNFHALKDCDPQLPETAFNRLADNWRPLFAIAEAVGKDWPKRVREDFAKLTSSDDLDAQGVGTTLLVDIAAIFKNEHTDTLASAKLAESLAAIEGRPWAEWGRHRKPISPNQLANLLHRFGISPRQVRVAREQLRGYELDGFRDTFDRYLPKPPLPGCHSVTTLGKTPLFEVSQPESVLHPENGHSTYDCDGVTLQKGGLQGEQCAGEGKEAETNDALEDEWKTQFPGGFLQFTSADDSFFWRTRGSHKPRKCTLCDKGVDNEPDWFEHYKSGEVRCRDCQEIEWMGQGFEVFCGFPYGDWQATPEERMAERASNELQKHERWARKAGLIEIANNCHEDAARFDEAYLRALQARTGDLSPGQCARLERRLKQKEAASMTPGQFLAEATSIFNATPFDETP